MTESSSAEATVDVTDPVDESLEDLYEHAPCGYLSSTLEGVVVRVNHTYLALTGYTAEQVLGKPFDSVFAVGSQLFWQTRCLPILRLKGEVREVAIVMTTAAGESLSVLLNSSVVDGPDGRPRLIRTAVFNATERQDYERDLLHARRAAERSEAQVRVLQTASATFDGARSPADVATSLVRIARNAFDATAAAVMFLDASGTALQSAGEGRHPVGDSILIDGPSPEAEAIRSGGIVRIGSIDDAEQAFPAIAPALEKARLAAMTAMPLLDNGVPLGVVDCFYGRRRDADSDEAELLEALTRQASQALHRIRLHNELHHMAQHDSLTGLANRASLTTRLDRVLAGSTRDRHPMAVIFLDLDGFKAINDQLGHVVGDAVLVQVADRLRAAVRHGDTTARFGGDEFVVVCADTDTDTAAGIAERIRDAVRRPLLQIPPAFPLTVSIGVVMHHPSGDNGLDSDALIRHADAAMYMSKRAGKNRTTVVQT